MYTDLDARTVHHYSTAAERGSTGALNSLFECAVVRAGARDGADKLYTTGSDKADWRIGRSTWVEVKSCCSETGGAGDPLEEIHRAHYILYTPDLPDEDTILHDAVACLETCLVFTADEFVEMLCYIHKGGMEPHIRQTSRGRWNIQTLRTYNKKTGKWSEVPYKKFWEFVRERNIPNASLEWVESVRK